MASRIGSERWARRAIETSPGAEGVWKKHPTVGNLGTLNCLTWGCVNISRSGYRWDQRPKAITTASVQTIAKLPQIRTLILPEL